MLTEVVSRVLWKTDAHCMQPHPSSALVRNDQNALPFRNGLITYLQLMPGGALAGNIAMGAGMTWPQ